MDLNDNDRSSIREAAYYRWLEAGAPAGDGVNFWLDAESDYLRSGTPLRGGDRGAQTAGGLVSRPDKEELIGSRG